MNSPERNPYLDHPFAATFVEASFEAYENNGSAVIPRKQVRELAVSLGLNHRQGATHAFLAMRCVDETRREIEDLSDYGLWDGGR